MSAVQLQCGADGSGYAGVIMKAFRSKTLQAVLWQHSIHLCTPTYASVIPAIIILKQYQTGPSLQGVVRDSLIVIQFRLCCGLPVMVCKLACRALSPATVPWTAAIALDAAIGLVKLTKPKPRGLP